MKIVIVGGTGYIGSRLFNHLKTDHYVDTVDLELFGNFVNPKNKKKNYKYIHHDFWDGYHAIVLLAGHSSVQMCQDKMVDSFQNNVANFINLINKTDTKIIYASSSSVYGNTKGVCVDETWDMFTPFNYYDLTKKTIDLYTQVAKKKLFGLRMGTVCGGSPNIRTDIMINKMYHSAEVHKKILIFNPQVNRPILGIDDFCRAVSVMLESDKFGIYNLASFNANINQISEEISKSLNGVEIVNTGDSPTYDFAINTEKFQTTFNFKFQDTIQSIVETLKSTYNTSNKGDRI